MSRISAGEAGASSDDDNASRRQVKKLRSVSSFRKQNDAVDGKTSKDTLARHSSTASIVTTTNNNKRQNSQTKCTGTRSQSRNTTTYTGLDGKYWNDIPSDRHTNQNTIDYRKFNDGDVSWSSSDSSSVSSMSSSEEEEVNQDREDIYVLYKNKTYLTCRSPSDSFYLCQVLQDVYQITKKTRIRWCSVVGEHGDDADIGINTRFKFDYEDTLHTDTILMNISSVIQNDDGTISLKKKDIADTKRLLQKSIRGESLSSDDLMDLSTERSIEAKGSNHLHFQTSDERDTESLSSSESPVEVSSKVKKRKLTATKGKSRKQPAKKRLRKTSSQSDGDMDTQEPKKSKSKRTGRIVKQRKQKASSKTSENDKKKATKASKRQLFKVHSNRSLQENLAVTKYEKEPFFEDKLPVPFISSFVQSKLAIRAVLTNDVKLLKSLINDVNHVCSVHVTRGVFNDLSALHYAVKNNNLNMVKILVEDNLKPKKKRCPFPTVSMTVQRTGTASKRMLGFRTARIMASRGAKEGNNALNKDRASTNVHIASFQILQYALQNNCSHEMYEFLCKQYGKINNLYENIHKIVQAGHRKLAAMLVEEIKDNIFHGFNNLHYQVLFYDNEDITINRATSAIKKTRFNFMITPIHCAAINPNVKYLKQLLNAMPEYNILDKYERRPIHFAAACEGPDPLEYLLSKQVSFNDIDRGGNSPLHIAVTHGRAQNAELLLRTAKDKAATNEDEDQVIHEKFGLASINRMNKSRFYPLHLAVLHNHLNCVKVLLEYDPHPDKCTSTASGKLTPLMLACQKGYLDIALHLIGQGARIEARDRFQRTPLIHACMCGNADIVSHLLRFGANADAFDSSMNTALHYAVAYGWYFCVQLLLEAGANLNCVNIWQTTCLAAGFLKGHYGLCDYLLTNHNADINFQTEDGLTLVMLTVGLEISSSAVEQLEYVVTKHKANCTTTDANGNNALHYLAENQSIENERNLDDNAKKALEKNFCQMAQILLANKCDPNKMNSKGQTPLMIALEANNFVLVDYLIDEANISITADISNDGKTLLHYFAEKCHKENVMRTLLKLPLTDEIKKMGKIFDEKGRTPLHYCSSKFNDFCQSYKSVKGTDELKKAYESIVRMIEYCLESVECDPDVPMKTIDEVKQSNSDDDNTSEDSDEEEEEAEEADVEDEEVQETNDEDEAMEQNESTENDDLQQVVDMSALDNSNESNVPSKETSIFLLLLTVPFIDKTATHPLEIFIKKAKDLNVLHHKSHRTPLLEAICLRQPRTATILIHHSLCDINLATSTISHEREKTPLIMACKLQLLSVVRGLLEHEHCDISARDHENNQAIHYYLQTSNRSTKYVDILNIFIKKIKLTTKHGVNTLGKHERTPLHIAVYHNSGNIDAVVDTEKMLIDNGSDLMMKDHLGNIPLHNVFLDKPIGHDPVDLCVLLLKSMKYKLIDTKNNDGFTPLHLAVAKCSTVCVMFLQQHNASLFIENNIPNSIIGTCISSGHLNLFITFLQQSSNLDLGKLHTDVDISTKSKQPEPKTTSNSFTPAWAPRKPLKTVNQTPIRLSKLKDNENYTWIWKYIEKKSSKESNQHSLIYLIIQRNWQGALSLILNEVNRFHLDFMQIIEAAILNIKLNLVLRLLLRLKDEMSINATNAHKQNLYHLIGNMNENKDSILEQILSLLHEHGCQWNVPDEYGSYPIHYACVKQNFGFINFLQDKYPRTFSLNQTDSFGNTPIGLLFWSSPCDAAFANEKFSSLITSGTQLDCLCNYNNETALDPLSFGYIDTSASDKSYPPLKTTNRIKTSPLINAVVHNNFPMVKFLLEHNANVDFADEHKRTPLMHAVLHNNIDIVKLLLNKNYTLDDNETGIAQPAVNRNVRGGKGLKGRFFLGVATTDTIDDDESTAKKNKSKKFQKTSKINLDATDIHGRTCIHHLVQPFNDGSYASSTDILNLLLSCGASFTTKDHSGLTPLDISIRNNSAHLQKELLLRSKSTVTGVKRAKFEINDPNKRLLEKIDYYSDAQNLIDDYVRRHPKHKSKEECKVDRVSGMSFTGEVVVDPDKNEPYDVRLTKVDINYGIYGLFNFYRMQIIKHKAKNNLYFLFTRWGRIGESEGQHQLTPFSTLDECRTEFLKVFREKTGNAWKDTNKFEKKGKKYSLVSLSQFDNKKHCNVPIDFDRLQAVHEQPPSKLYSPVYKELMRSLIDRQAFRKNIHMSRLDVEWMPISQLKRETIEEARGLLHKIQETIEKKEKLGAASHHKTADQKNEIKSMLETIHQYTNDYYALIPSNGYVEGNLPILDNITLVQTQEKLLDDLCELELSYKILLGAQANLKTISPLDYLYKSMNCQFQALNPDDSDSQFILRYAWASSPDVKVEQIFKISRDNDDERMMKSKIDNRHLLWHGTNVCNLISILTRGLLVRTLAAAQTGSLFGTGIYTSDTFAKSLGYCSGVEQNDGERCFMLLCEVALGKVQEIGGNRNGNDGDDSNDVNKPLDLKRYQSRKGVGQRIPDPKHTIVRRNGVHIPLGQLIDNKDVQGIFYYYINYNEYIVYDEAQVALRYLVQFRR